MKRNVRGTMDLDREGWSSENVRVNDDGSHEFLLFEWLLIYIKKE